MKVRVTQTGFILLEDSAQILHTIFPHYPELSDCNKVPDLEVVQAGEQYVTELVTGSVNQNQSQSRD